MKYLAAALIRFYQIVISPLLPGARCRYHPSCSAYAMESFRRHGFAAGMGLTLSRLLRCHPWSRGSMRDPVPERFAWGDFIRYNRSADRTEQKDRLS